MRHRPNRGFARTNLIWVIGVAAGVLAGGVVAYSLATSAPTVVVATSH